MFRTSVAILALAMLPTIASAQGGRNRDRGTKDNSDELMKSAPTGPNLSSKDFESMSPIRFLFDKRKDLKLSDEQTRQFKDADGKLREKNSPLLKAVDSLVREMKPTSSVASTEDQVRSVVAREALMGVIGEIRENYDRSVKELMPSLDDAQKTTALSLLQKQSKENEETLREKMGVGGSVPFGIPAGRGRRGGSAL